MLVGVPNRSLLEAAIVADELRRRLRTDGGEMFEAQGYQAAFFEHTSKRVLAHGGNRSGKTRCCAQYIYEKLVGKRGGVGPFHWRACGSGWEEHVEKVLVPMFERIIPRRFLEGDKFNYSSRSHMLFFKDGSDLEFMSFDQDPEKGAGRPLHGVWLDESYACSKRFRDQCLARLLDYHGEMIASLTPEDGDASWEIEWYEKARSGDPDYQSFRFPTRENKYISKEGIAQLIRDCGDDEVQIAIRLDGDFASVGGKIYPSLKALFHVKHSHEVGVSEDWVRFIAIDPGVSKAHALLWGAVGPGNHIHFYRELSMGGEIGPLCDTIRRFSALDGPIFNFFLDGHWDWDNRVAAMGDSHEPLNIEREFIKHGIPVVKAPRDIRNWIGIDQVRQRLRPDPITHMPQITFDPECQQTWWEMTHYSQIRPGKNDPSRHNPRIRKVDDDFCDCVRIAITSNPVFMGGWDGSLSSNVVIGEYGLGF